MDGRKQRAQQASTAFVGRSGNSVCSRTLRGSCQHDEVANVQVQLMPRKRSRSREESFFCSNRKELQIAQPLAAARGCGIILEASGYGEGQDVHYAYGQLSACADRLSARPGSHGSNAIDQLQHSIESDAFASCINQSCISAAKPVRSKSLKKTLLRPFA